MAMCPYGPVFVTFPDTGMLQKRPLYGCSRDSALSCTISVVYIVALLMGIFTSLSRIEEESMCTLLLLIALFLGFHSVAVADSFEETRVKAEQGEAWAQS